MQTLIIAEAACNHDGSMDKAVDLCIMAKESGADAVKFQTFIPDSEELKKYALGKHQFKLIKDYCDGIGIEFMSTPFCQETAQWLQDIGVWRFKISSGNVTNMGLLKKVASFRREVILSLGMSTLKEREDAIATLVGYGLVPNNLVLMYCRSIYPVLDHQVCLGELRKLMRYKVRVGFSDHTMSTIIPTYAVVMGATVIEKHFTLDRSLPGADHHMSLDPHDFKAMVQNVRWAEMVISTGPVIDDNEKELREVWLEKARRQNVG
jgi:N,N'-diacetyllegionaminate synthase